MRFLCSLLCLPSVCLLTVCLVLASPFSLHAQTAGSIHGQITDPTGAIIPGAAVELSGSGGSFTASSGADGRYSFGAVPPGSYTLEISVPGFTPLSRSNVAVAAGASRSMDISLSIATQEQQVQVTADASQIDTEPADNGNAVVISGKALDALSDDPDEMENELTALAGPGAGNSGAQIFIDGFTGGQMPPKSAIREIRINQNPFSAEYDKLGYGRIEILTKPGFGQMHGEIEVNGNTSGLNTTHFVTNPPSYYEYYLDGSIGGPINKNASWFFSIFTRNMQNLNIVNAQGTLEDPNYYGQHGGNDYIEGVLNPQTRIYLSPRVDLQLTPNNTLTVRYQYNRGNESGDGVGQLDLASQGYSSYFLENTVQISDSQVLGPHLVNEIRFQYERDRDQQVAEDFSPTVTVQGAFTGGGSNQGVSHTHVDHYEFQDETTASLRRHTLHLGTRLRAMREADSTNAGANGAYIFTDVPSFLAGRASLGTVTRINNAEARATLFDAALYLQDDWKVNDRLTLDPGLRFEAQNRIHDHADWGPRLSMAWAIDGGGHKPPKTVLRAGYGWFFTRFADGQIIQAIHQNGRNQVEEVFTNPVYVPGRPPTGQGTISPSSAVYSISPQLKAQLDMQGAVGLDRRISRAISSNVTFLYSRGVHQYLSDNINAPLYNYATNTFLLDPEGQPLRPIQDEGNLYQFQSGGVYRQKQLIVTVRGQARRFSLGGYYALGFFDSDTSGPTYFPSRQYDIAFDYGRAGNDIRNRLAVFGEATLPFHIELSPLLLASSGDPFNITTGQDSNGDQQFNERPAFAPASDCIAGGGRYFATRYGCLDSTPNLPTAGGTFHTGFVPVNYGRGPANVNLNLRLSKNFGLGPKVSGHGGGPDGHHGFHGRGLSGGYTGNSAGGGGATPSDEIRRRYNLSFTVYGRNVFNIVNLAQPNNVLISPNFDRSLALAGGAYQQRNTSAVRAIYLETRFSF